MAPDVFVSVPGISCMYIALPDVIKCQMSLILVEHDLETLWKTIKPIKSSVKPFYTVGTIDLSSDLGIKTA